MVVNCVELTLFMAAGAQGSEPPRTAKRPLESSTPELSARLGTELNVSYFGIFFSFCFFEGHLSLILGVRAPKLEQLTNEATPA